MSNNIQNDVKQLAANIETLARAVQAKLDSNANVLQANDKEKEAFLNAANELVRNNVTFTFALGEFYALEQLGSNKTVQGSVVSNPSGTTHKYHNVRDSLGRFAKKV